MPSDVHGPVGTDPAGATPRQVPFLGLVLPDQPRALLALVFVVLGSGGFALLFLLPVGAAWAAIAWLQWSRLRWGFDGTVLRVEQGVLQRQTRALDAARIQQVEIEQPLLHRMVDLAVVRLETASEGAQTEVQLHLTMADAQALRAALRPPGRRPAAGTPGDAAAVDLPPPVVDEPVLQLSIRDLAVSAVTGAQLLAFPVVLLVLVETLSDVGAEGAGLRAADALAGAGIAVLVLVVAVGTFLAATITAVLRDGDYTVVRRGDDLVIRRGLLTTRETVLPRSRVQVVEVRQNWLRRVLGVASVHVRSAGGGAARSEERRILVPLVRGPHLAPLLGHLLPDHPGLDALVPHPPRARRRAMVRWTLRVLLPATAIGAGAIALEASGLGGGGLVAGVVAIAVLLAGPLLGAIEYEHLAHALGDDVMVTRHGALGITVSYAPLRRLQGVTESTSPFQSRLGLASVVAHLAGAGATTSLVVPDVGAPSAIALRQDLTRAASTA